MNTLQIFSHGLRTMLVVCALVFSPALFAADEPLQLTMPVAKVDINSADAATLAQVLDGVGMAKALEIVAYREMHGKFNSLEQLAEVKGIGVVTVEKNRDRIVITEN